MAQKHELIFKNDSITLTKGIDGYWLYDKSRGMNLSMKADSERSAFVESLEYYTNRLLLVESENKEFLSKIETIQKIISTE
jgi:hypothetical protein